MRLNPWLALVRIPNLPTVAADILGGFVIAGGLLPLTLGRDQGMDKAWSVVSRPFTYGDPSWWSLPILLLASAFLYSGGMADNDVQHVHKDRAIGKERPITLGSISYLAAAKVTILLMAGGIVMASLAGRMADKGMAPAIWLAVIAFAIVLCMKAYNRVAAGKVVDESYVEPGKGANATGALLMSLCRVGNFSLGLILGATAGADIIRIAALESASSHQFSSMGDLYSYVILTGLWKEMLTVLLYFLCVMGVSLSEDFGGGKRGLWALRIGVLVPIWLLYIARTLGGAYEGEFAIAVVGGASLLALTALLQFRFQIAINDPTPRNVGMIVKWSIAGYCLLMAGLSAQPLAGLSLGYQLAVPITLIVCFFMCWLLGKFSYAT